MNTTTEMPDSIPDTRTEDNAKRQRWRDAQRRYYERNRARKLELIERYRQDHPDCYRETRNLSLKRSRRGIQRAYRREDTDA